MISPEETIAESSDVNSSGWFGFLRMFVFGIVAFFAIFGVMLYTQQAALLQGVFEQLQTDLEAARSSFAVDSFELPDIDVPTVDIQSMNAFSAPETIEVGP